LPGRSEQLVAFAECYAELALARLVAEKLERPVRVVHKSGKGGHDPHRL